MVEVPALPGCTGLEEDEEDEEEDEEEEEAGKPVPGWGLGWGGLGLVPAPVAPEVLAPPEEGGFSRDPDPETGPAGGDSGSSH